jgi:hypothetical protein
VVRGRPERLRTEAFEVIVYATNVAILGPVDEVYRVRAAIHRHLGLTGACLTWSEESQKLEDDLTELHRAFDGDLDGLIESLDRLQEEIDRASLTSDEWNILYRLRLQVERAARLRIPGRPTASGRAEPTSARPSDGESAPAMVTSA